MVPSKIRVVPIFPEIRGPLREVYEEAPEGSEHVIRSYRAGANLNPQLYDKLVHGTYAYFTGEVTAVVEFYQNGARIGEDTFKVVGVLDTYMVTPKYYDVTNGAFDDPESYYVPFNLVTELRLNRSGNTNCWKPVDDSGYEAFLNSECVWIQFWAELPSSQEQQEYLTFLDSYAEAQKELGRFPRPLNNRINDVMEWMEVENVVDDGAQVVMWLSIMFLAVCLLNTIGLLLTKFSTKAAEIGLRRALGASKKALFIQHSIESTMIGIGGGIVGLVLAWLGLIGIVSLFGDDVAHLASLDITMVVFAIGLAVVSALLAGIYPTWRACNIQPAVQLKTQ